MATDQEKTDKAASPRNRMKRIAPKANLAEFNEALAYFSLAANTEDRVRRVLVDGEAIAWVASSENIKYPALSRACDKVLSKIEELRDRQQLASVGAGLPTGWAEETFIAPEAFLSDMRKQLARYLQEIQPVAS